jgi:hypothetical protein
MRSAKGAEAVYNISRILDQVNFGLVHITYVVVDKIKILILCLVTFSEIFAIYEIMLKNVLEPGRL